MDTGQPTPPPAPSASYTERICTPILDRVFPPAECDDAWAEELLQLSLASLDARAASASAHAARWH